MNDASLRQYTNEEIHRIIRRALTLQRTDAITHQELIETARELGIDPRTVEAAIAQEHQEAEKETIRTAWLQHRKAQFHRHLWTYGIVNGALFLINLLTPGPWWFQWPLLGWGIGLAFRFRGAYFPSEETVERGVSRMRSRGRRAG